MYHIKHKGEDNLPRNRKLLAKKSSMAHQYAPIDYISPWQAQHHFHLIQSHHNQNLQSKVKSSEHQLKVDNVVNSFLQKVRKNSKYRGKNKLIKNFSLQSEQHSTSNNSYTATPNSYSNTPIVRKMKKDGLCKSYTYDGPDDKQRAITEGGAQNVGFGFLKYSKNNLEKLENLLTENNETEDKLKFFRNPSPNIVLYKTKNQASLCTHSQKQQPQFQNQRYYEQPQNTSYKFDDQITLFKNDKLAYSKKRIFTEQQRQKPQQIVFIKKKKQNNNMAVVDINVTAQQFYDEQLKYIENAALRKYGKKAKSQMGKNERYFTQESAKQSQTIFKYSMQRNQKRNRMNQTGYAQSIIQKRRKII